MRLAEFIYKLKKIHNKHGDIEVVDSSEINFPLVEVNGPEDDLYLLITDDVSECPKNPKSGMKLVCEYCGIKCEIIKD